MEYNKPYDKIGEWFMRGVTEAATHMFILAKGGDSDNVIVDYVNNTDPYYKIIEWSENPEFHIIEIYSMSWPLEAQLYEKQAWNL